ncbi:MAG: hypothetical protein HKN07_14925 [Acidimicrobiia bacterium]|nr:hypothetical protein [Acidimicrobiia bacterium]NNF65533.1 hypothetical protein [Acidimicrobiia bacterium]
MVNIKYPASSRQATLVAVLASAILMCGVAVAQAQTGVAAFPNSFEFEGPLRGGTAVQSLGLVNDAGEARLLRFVTIGDVGPWIEVRQVSDGEAIETFAIGAGGDATFDLAVIVPDDIANGTYEGALRVLSGSTEPDDAAVEIGVELPVIVTVNGTQVIAAAMEDFTVGTAEVGTPLPLSVEIRNEGNVAISPQVTVVILTATDEEVASITFAETRIRPGESAVVVDAWSTTSADVGAYVATANATIGSVVLPSRIARFELAPGGSFTRSGEIVSLELANRPEAGGIAIVNAELRNSSEVTAGIRFNGELIYAGGRIGDVGSLARRVGPDETTIVQVFMEVARPGEYQLSGSADVDGILSRPTTFAFSVGAAEGRPVLLYFSLAAGALVLVGLIVWRRRATS